MIAKMVEERIDVMETHITWTEIANKLQLDKSTLSKFRNQNSELNFNTLLELSQLIFPRNYTEVLSDWCVSLRRPCNIKLAFEFLSSNRKIDHLKEIIKKTSETTGSKLLKELCVTYSILINHQLSNLTDEDFLHIDSQNFKNAESNFLLIMAKIYYYNFNSQLTIIPNLLKSAENFLNEISDKLLLKYYQDRVNEIISITALYNEGDTLKSREYSERILKNEHLYCATYLANGYYRMGMSFLFDSPDMCLAYLKKSQSLFEKDGKTTTAKNLLKNEITFAKIHWDLINSSEDVEDDSNRAFLAARNGESNVMDLLATLEQESPFTKYYEGLAKNDSNILLESLIMFKNAGNLFYANLPKQILKNHKPMENIVKLILN